MNHVQSLHLSFELDKITVIRFNPDTWRVHGIVKRFKKRLELLKQVIIDSIEKQENGLEVFHMFYPITDGKLMSFQNGKEYDPIVQSTQQEIEQWITNLLRNY